MQNISLTIIQIICIKNYLFVVILFFIGCVKLCIAQTLIYSCKIIIFFKKIVASYLSY